MDDTYKTYVKQILQYPLLTAEQEKELSQKIHQGNTNAKMKLINGNLRLVVSVAQKYSNGDISVMDLIQEGNIGLITAAGKYHFSYNTRFSTYAYAWIAQYMLRYIQHKGSFISLPVRKEELVHKIETAKNELLHKFNRDPSTQELSLYTGISEADIESCKRYVFSIASIDAEIDGNSGQTLGDMLPDLSLSPEKEIMTEYDRKQIFDMVQDLPQNERLVIENRYCLLSHEKKTLRQVGDILGVSAETVRQVEKRALVRMRKTVNADIEQYAV